MRPDYDPSRASSILTIGEQMDAKQALEQYVASFKENGARDPRTLDIYDQHSHLDGFVEMAEDAVREIHRQRQGLIPGSKKVPGGDAKWS